MAYCSGSSSCPLLEDHNHFNSSSGALAWQNLLQHQRQGHKAPGSIQAPGHTPLRWWFADKLQSLLHCGHTLPDKRGGSKVVENCVMNIPGDIAAKEAQASSLESSWLVEGSTEYQGVIDCTKKREVLWAAPLD